MRFELSDPQIYPDTTHRPSQGLPGSFRLGRHKVGVFGHVSDIPKSDPKSNKNRGVTIRLLFFPGLSFRKFVRIVVVPPNRKELSVSF